MFPISCYYYIHNVNVEPHRIKKNRISYYDLTIVLHGELDYEHDNASVKLGPGDFILIRPGEYRYRLASEIPSEYISFNFSCNMELDSIPTVVSDALNPELSSLLSACDRLSRTEHDLDKIAYLLGAILLSIRDSITDSRINPLALKIKNHILRHYTERITLRGIAEKFHFSPSYCNTVFKKELQKPIGDYLIETRTRKAMELLTHTKFTLPEIASKVGYDDYNYFSRIFKRHTHFTPSQYRARYSGK